MATTAEFDGFPPEALAFLSDLKANNNRDWFHAHRDIFKGEVEPRFHALLRAIDARATAGRLGFRADPKRSAFRIYRDVRFSKDKSPYKPHVSAFMTPTGDKKDPVGIYLHIEPGHCFLGAGSYYPPRPELTAIRRRIADDADAFLAIVADLEAKGMAIDPIEKLSRLPKEFSGQDDRPAADFLKFKCFLVRRDFSEIACLDGSVVDEVIAFAQDVTPLTAFLDRAVATAEPAA